ncbi:hypothetical protein D3C84_889500 [compost metagenome]
MVGRCVDECDGRASDSVLYSARLESASFTGSQSLANPGVAGEWVVCGADIRARLAGCAQALDGGSVWVDGGSACVSAVALA